MDERWTKHNAFYSSQDLFKAHYYMKVPQQTLQKTMKRTKVVTDSKEYRCILNLALMVSKEGAVLE